MKSKHLLSLILLSFVLLQPVLGQSSDTLRKINELFAHYHNEMPGIAVAIELNGELIYNKAFGMADLERQVPFTTRTISESGSVAKQFTAAAILLLIQEGKLSIDDDIRKFVPELPQYDAPITIRHLLSHTCGLREWTAIARLRGWPRTSKEYTLEQVYDIIFRQKSLNFTPGTRHGYNNSNYSLMVLIVERVSGMSFEEFTSKYFFEPLGLKDTQWRSDHREIIRGRAIAYSERDQKFSINMPNDNVHGAGGLLTTTADLLRWNRLLETNELFSKEIANLRIEPGMLNCGESSGYAAGFFIGEWNGFKEISHSGATAGYRAWLAWYPEKRLSVALLSNYAMSRPVRAGRDIAAIFLGRPEQRDTATAEPEKKVEFIPTAKLTDYSGSFHSEEVDVTFKLEVRNNELWVFRKPGDTFKLTASENDVFKYNDDVFRFQRNRRGRVTGFTVCVPMASKILFRKL